MIRDLFSTGAMGALAPAILKIGLLVPAILGQSNTVSTLNSKVLNRPRMIVMVNDGKNLVKADCERPPV